MRSLILLVLLATIACKNPPPTPTAPVRPADYDAQVADARIIVRALEAYAVDHNAYPTVTSLADLRPLVVPTYLPDLPARDLRVTSTANAYAITTSTGYPLLAGTR